MKPRTTLIAILAIVAAFEIVVAIVLDALGFKGGAGQALLGASLCAAASAVPLYVVAVRPLAARLDERRKLSRKAVIQDVLIGIDTMALQGAEPDAMLRNAAEDVRRLLRVPRCTFWLFGTPDAVAEHREMTLPPAATHFPLRESPEARLESCRTGNCTAVEDVRKAAAYGAVAEELERFGARSFIEAPLYVPEGLIGFLLVCRPEARAWSEDAVLLAKSVAWQAGTALGHMRRFREREDTSSCLLSLMDHVPALVYRGERDWTMSIVSAEVERMTGFTPQEFLDGTVNWKNLIHPDDLLSIKLSFRDAVARKQMVLRVEYRCRHRNGSYRWFADRRHIIYDDEGRFLHVDGVCFDITDRKRAENWKAATAAIEGVHTVS